MDISIRGFMIKGANHYTISCSNLEKSFSFYKDVLGFKPLMKHAKGAYFLAGDLWFCIDLGETSPTQDYTHLSFTVDQTLFKQFSEEIISSGTKLWKENKSEGDSLYFLDPDGHKFEIHVGDWKTRINHYKGNSNLKNPEYFI